MPTVCLHVKGTTATTKLLYMTRLMRCDGREEGEPSVVEAAGAATYMHVHTSGRRNDRLWPDQGAPWRSFRAMLSPYDSMNLRCRGRVWYSGTVGCSVLRIGIVAADSDLIACQTVQRDFRLHSVPANRYTTTARATTLYSAAATRRPMHVRFWPASIQLNAPTSRSRTRARHSPRSVQPHTTSAEVA